SDVVAVGDEVGAGDGVAVSGDDEVVAADGVVAGGDDVAADLDHVVAAVDEVAAGDEVVTAADGESIDAAGGADAVAGDDGSAEVPEGIAAELPTSASAMDALQLKYLIEALIFASDKPVTLARLRQLTRVSEMRRIEQALEALAEDYRDRGLVLQQVSGGYQF